MRKKNGTGGINLPDFRLYYKATVIKTLWYWHKNRNIDQWNKIESPEINLCTMVTLSLTKEVRIHYGEKTVSSISGAGKAEQLPCKRMKLEHFLTPYAKINCKWIQELNVRPETIKILEKNIGSTFFDINHGKILFDPPPTVMEIKTKINKWDLIRFKSFGAAKETINKLKRQLSEWEKIIANEATDKGLPSNIYKQFIQLSIRKTRSPVKRWA